MSATLSLHPDRLLPINSTTRDIARRLYKETLTLPIISPHGHTDPRWFAYNHNFSNPTELLIKPDHYIFRMLYSQGIGLERLGIVPQDGDAIATSAEEIWSLFAENYHLFRGTPSRIWLDYVFSTLFDIEVQLSKDTAAHYYETISNKLALDSFRPRALFEKFNIELLATTESPVDTLSHHRAIANSGWAGNVITTFRPDSTVDPEFDGFSSNITLLGELTGEDVSNFSGYIRALRKRREFFKAHGATSTDHGHPSAFIADLPDSQKERLYQEARAGTISAVDSELFRGQMLTEMAAMSTDDGLVMQIHPGAYRNHNQALHQKFGRDKGADVPVATEYVNNLRPLLNKYGNNPRLQLILFTLDESTYSRELAPLAGHYPCLKLGPAWWFHDSPEGMRRYRQQITETAGFYNTVGFNDDTRAFMSIPARHDVARRMDCGFLAELVADHRLTEDEAHELVLDLSYNLVKSAYKLAT